MTGRVLVVDDVEQNVKLLEAKLSNEYFTVYTATNGKEGIEKVRQLSPDIVLLDVMMPEMDGFEVCRRLKADGDVSYIPVVMVTALNEQDDRVEGLRAGANDFITKPIDEMHLFARVRSLVRIKLMLDELRIRDKTGIELGLLKQPSLDYDKPVRGTVLVVDDDIVQSKMISEHLKNAGDIAITATPDELSHLLESNTPDMLIVSTMLDDTDGLRLAMDLRSSEKTRQIPIMILVDEDDKRLMLKGLELGIDDYLMCPLDPNELLARVNTQLRRKKYQDMLKISYEESISAAVVDSLTKLYNRRYLDVHLANIVNDCQRRNADLTVLSLDIDHFKSVNDHPGWGHHIGDEVLKEVAQRILKSIRNTDLATRPGGEEFVVILPSTNQQNAMVVAERIRTAVCDHPFFISAEPGQLKSSVSIGMASLNKKGDTSEMLLKRSDLALYTAKNQGRNRVIVQESD